MGRQESGIVSVGKAEHGCQPLRQLYGMGLVPPPTACPLLWCAGGRGSSTRLRDGVAVLGVVDGGVEEPCPGQLACARKAVQRLQRIH